MESPQRPTRDELLGAVDACRPRSADLDEVIGGDAARAVRADRELSDRYRRIQSLDAALADEFRRGAVPVGLAERLAAALAVDAAIAAASEATAAAETSAAAGAIPADSPTPARAAAAPVDDGPPASTRRWSRRGWLAACGGVLGATAAGVAFVWWRQLRELRDLTFEDVCRQALALHTATPPEQQSRAVSIARQSPPGEFPLSRYVAGGAAVRWRPLDGRLLGRPGVVYELAPAGEPRATLYVVAGGRLGAPTVADLPDAPVERPIATGGCTAAAWREGDCLYALVVDGDQNRYDAFVHPAGGVFA